MGTASTMPHSDFKSITTPRKDCKPKEVVNHPMNALYMPEPLPCPLAETARGTQDHFIVCTQLGKVLLRHPLPVPGRGTGG